MGQKVHPNLFRLGISTHHSSQWFTKVGSSYSATLQQDTFIRTFFQKKISDSSIHSIQIQRKNTALLLNIESSRPQEILVHLEEWKKELAKELSKMREETDRKAIGIERTSREISANSIFCILSQPKELSAQSIANSVKEKLEERLPFRKAMKNSIRLAKSRGLKGMKIEISGRLNGAEIARTEWERYGSVSLQTLRTPIDFYAGIAHTIYGVLGIKVWVQ